MKNIRPLAGIHHVTAITGNTQANVDFYTGLLGLRLVKVTINFDDPGVYHLYYGNESGEPGTIITFFAWSGVTRGRQGSSQIASTSFTIPEAALGFWIDRLLTHKIEYKGPEMVFGERVLSFRDPDGMSVELVAQANDTRSGWEGGPVPAEFAVRGISHVTLWEDQAERTIHHVTEKLGFRFKAEDGNTKRFETGEGGPGTYVDVRDTSGFWRGSIAGGSIHHVAWRTPNDAEQERWLTYLAEQQVHPTAVQDRSYFHSVYFREPGGVLFEIATDEPGFVTDEDLHHLGNSLQLPSWLEASRAKIEALLPPFPRAWKAE